MPPKSKAKKFGPQTLAQAISSLQRMRVRPKARQQTKKSKPAKVRSGMNTISLNGSSSASKYAAAILYPFAKQAEGARVPEPFSVASIVDKAHTTWTVGTTAGSGQSFDVVLTPHLLQSAHSGIGTLSGGTGGFVYNSAGLSNFPTGVTCRAVTSSSTLSTRYKSYRIVSWGVRIKPNVSFTNASGRIFVAVASASQQTPLYVSSAASKQDWYDNLDAPYDSNAGGLPSNLLNMPRSKQFTMTELIALGGVELTLPLTSGAAKTFIEAKNEYTEQSLVIQSGSGVNIPISAGYGSSAGFSQVFIYGEGCGTSGVATDILSIDVIYHVEAIPNISGVTGGLVSAAPYTPPPSGPNAEHAVHAHVAMAPIFKAVIDKAKEEGKVFVQSKMTDFLKKNIPRAGEMVLGLL